MRAPNIVSLIITCKHNTNINISVMMEGDNKAMWSRSPASSYWCRLGKYSNDKNGNESAGFANPPIVFPAIRERDVSVTLNL